MKRARDEHGAWAWLSRWRRPRGEATDVEVRRLTWTPDLVDRFWAGVSQTRLTECNFSRLGGKGLVLAIEHHLPKDGIVLDYGAGDGDLVEYLLDRAYKVAAYEPSGSRNQRLIDRVAGRQGFLGLIDDDSKQQFDVVLMVEVIEHVLDQDLNRTLKNVYRLLKKGGILVVTTPNNEDLDFGMAYCPVSGRLFHRWQHVRSFTAESLSGLFIRYWFSPIVVHQVEFRPEFFLPYDELWGGEQFVADTPSYLKALRMDTSVQVGSGSNLLFIGRKA